MGLLVYVNKVGMNVLFETTVLFGSYDFVFNSDFRCSRFVPRGVVHLN